MYLCRHDHTAIILSGQSVDNDIENDDYLNVVDRKFFYGAYYTLYAVHTIIIYIDSKIRQKPQYNIVRVYI